MTVLGSHGLAEAEALRPLWSQLNGANIGRFTRMVQEMSRDTQFILITHSKKTMTIAPVLYGVTMQEHGVSKIVSVKFNGAAPAAPARTHVFAETAV